MIEISVYNKEDRKIGSYTTTIIPRVGEYLDAKNGQWTVIQVQHDIRGALDMTAPGSFQTCVIVYVDPT
tara:strand:- start:244 stop:450 length:207 start_codon:yes stop_codon:yes gene_type:complete